MRHKGSTTAATLSPHFITVIIFIFTFTATTDARKCNLNCAGSTGNLLKFQPGKTYQYKLEGSSVTTLPGAKNDVSKLGIEGIVEISLASGCEHVLTLSGVKTVGPDGKKYNLDSNLGNNALKFGLQNGKISDLCATENESEHALNIKRAILSLIQSSVLKDSGFASQNEVDIYGSCPTNFEFVKQSGGGIVIVRKTKDLTKCSHREQYDSPYSTSTYLVQSELQSSPLLLGTVHTEKKLEGGLLKQASSEEVYKYDPSSAEAATTIKINTKLSFVSQSDKPCPTANGNEGKTLLFEPEHATDNKGGVQTIIELLRLSCDTRTVEPDGATKFSNLVRAVAKAPKSELLQIYQQVKNGQGFKEKDIAKRMFIDAVVQGKSASNIEVIAELLKTKEVTGYKALYCYYVLGVVKHATRASLNAVATLFDENSPSELYLGAGALAGRFCREHNCQNIPEVLQFQNKLAGPLLTKGCKPTTKKEEDILIASLKGLANVNYLSKPIVARLVDNARDSTIKTRIRAAIFDTIRSDANKPEFKTVAGEVLKNYKEDTEIRIKAYLTLTECPCGKVAAIIKSVLENEKSFQVGSFIVSHLRNLKASTSPHKASAKHHLGAIVASEKFPIDVRKYSQNFELSYNVDALNFGASGESNVIYSQKSYIPRSMSLNLTSYLFGRSINWLEVDLRTENLEKTFEKILGPRGYFRKGKYNEVYEEIQEDTNSILETAAEKYENSMRPKRSVSRTQLNTLAEKVNLHHEAEDEVDIDLSMKVYGSETVWMKYHSSDRNDIKNIVDDMFEGLDETITSAKALDVDYRKHLVFLDDEVLYPTGLGLPLKIKTLGTSAFRVKLDGKLDIPSLIKDQANTDIRLQFIPSAAIELRGDIVLDGIAIEAGVKVNLNLHTSTGSDLTFRVIDGNGIDVKFGLPIKKQDLLTITTDIASIVKHNNNPEQLSPIAFDVKRERHHGCFDQLNEPIGLIFCGEVDLPWDGSRFLSPAYGPSKLSLHVDKEDTLTSYHFKIYGNTDKEGVKSFEILFDTPNSKINRKVALNLETCLAAKKYAKASLSSPWANALLEASLVNTPKEFSVNAKFIYNDIEYYLKTGAMKSQEGNAKRYEPVLEFKIPEQGKSALIGRKGGPKPTTKAITLSGALVAETTDKGVSLKFEDLSLETPRTKYSLVGTGGVYERAADIDLTINYEKEHVKLKGHLKESDKQLNTQLSILHSQNKDFNLNVKWDALKDEAAGKYESKLIIQHGPEENNEISKITLINKLEINSKDNIFGTENSIAYPVVNLDGYTNFRITPKSIRTDLKGKFDKYSGQISVKGEVNTKKEGDYNIEIRWALLGNSVEINLLRKVLKNHQSKFINIIDIKPGGRYELQVHATHKINDQDMDISADVDLVLPADPKNVKLKTGLKHNNAETRGHLNAISGNKQYVQTDFNVKKGEKMIGNYKLKVLDYINSNGDFQLDSKNFKGKSKIDLLKVGRQLEAKTNVLFSDKNFNGDVDFCWDTKNPSKSIKIKTDTKLEDNSLDSKNSITIGSKQIVLNVNGVQSGGEKKGRDHGELQLILPDGQTITIKGSDTYDITDENNISGESETEVIYLIPSVGSYKVDFKTIGKNIDIENVNFDTQFSLSFSTPDKKDLSTNIILKKIPKNNEKWMINVEESMSGSLLKSPLDFKLISEVPFDFFDFDDSKEISKMEPLLFQYLLKAGSDIKVEGSGKIGPTVLIGDFIVEAPEDSHLTSMKWVTYNTADLSDEDITKQKLKSRNELSWGKGKFIKISGEANGEPNGLNYVAEWESDTVTKTKLSGSLHSTVDANSKKADGNFALTWDGKSADLSIKLERINDVGTIHILGSTPVHGKFDLLLKNKIIKNGKTLHSDLTITVKDKKIAVSTKIENSELHPLYEIVIDHPEGKSRFLWKVDIKGERHWSSEIKAKWSGASSGSFSLDSELLLKSIDNFFIKHNFDIPQAGLRKLQVDLGNRPGRGEGKKITLTIKRDEKLIASASSNYVVREDGDEKLIEGNGNIKIDDKQYPLSFKGSWQSSGNEKKAKLLVKSDNKYSVNIEYVNTPNEFNFVRTMCREDKCTKAQLLHRVRSSGFNEYDHTLIVAVDLSLLRIEGVKDVSYISSFKRRDNKVDNLIEWKYDNKVIYKYNAYNHDNDAGILITIPKRTVGFVVKYDVGNGGDKTRDSSLIELDIYLNKETDDKICFISSSNVEKQGNSIKVTAETKLSHPSLKKDLAIRTNYNIMNLDINGEVVIDVFKHDSQKIILNFRSNTVNEKDGRSINSHTLVNVKSIDCKIDATYEYRLTTTVGKLYAWSHKLNFKDSHGKDKEIKTKYSWAPNEISFIIKLPSAVLLSYDIKEETKGQDLIISNVMVVGSKKATETVKYNQETNKAFYSLRGDGVSLDGEFGVLVGKSALLKITCHDKPAGVLEVALDEANFLKSTYSYDPDVIKNIWKSTNELSQILEDEMEGILTNAFTKASTDLNHFIDCIFECLPNYDALMNHVKNEAVRIRDEIATDPQISNTLKQLKEAFGTIYEQMEVIEEEFNKLLGTLIRFTREIAETVRKVSVEISSKLLDACKKFIEISTSILEQYVKLFFGVMEQVLDELKKYKEDIDAVLKVIADVAHDVGKQFAKVILVINDEITKFISINIAQLKELPVANMIREKLEDLKEFRVPEEFWIVYEEVIVNIKQFLPTAECEDFVSTLSAYISKILKQEDFDLTAAGNELYEKCMKALRSIMAKVNEINPKQEHFKPEKYVSLPASAWLKLPAATIKSSILNLLGSPDFLIAIGSLETFAFSLNPLDNIPPFRGYAHIIMGTEIITFDGRHYGVKGMCSYVLAEDYVDRNFSLVGHFNGGKLDAITVWDRKHSVTVRKDGSPLKDGLESEYPMKIGLLQAWKNANSVGIRSDAGIKLICPHNLQSCAVEVSGFYFNKLRGLFGNLNYEQYDDLVLPKGEFGSDPETFCNSWKVETTCPDIPAVPHTHQRQKLCTEFFASDDSDLILGRPWLPLKPFRDACDHLVATSENKHQAACQVAKHFVFIARRKGAFLLEIPSECIVCDIDNKKIDSDNSVTISRGKAADIVFIVDAIKDNEDIYKTYVQKLVPQLKAELNKNGINDIKVALVSFNSPTHNWNYHSVHGKIEFNGADCLLEFENAEVLRDRTWLDRLITSKEKFYKDIGNTQRSKAYFNVINYHPFRPNAYRSIIGVHSESCSVGSFFNPMIPLKIILKTYLTMNRGIVFNLISPVKSLTVDPNHGCTNNEVVAFTDDEMYTINKGTLKGEPDFDLDFCIASAQLTGGAVLPISNLREFNQQGNSPAVIQKTAEVLTKSILSSKTPLECECDVEDGVYVRPLCTLED